MKKEITVQSLLGMGFTPEAAASLAGGISKVWATGSAVAQWSELSHKHLSSNQPFALHLRVYQTTFQDWDVKLNGPAPAWMPDSPHSTNLYQMQHELGLSSYAAFHSWSIEKRETFWQHMIDKLGIVFKKPYTKLLNLDKGAESPQWMVGAKMNIADSCFLAPGTDVALIYQKEGGPLETLTYAELKSLSSRVANGLVKAGFKTGDAIAIDMAMTVEAVAIYLGIVMSGCAAVSIADSFAAEEIKTRLEITKAKAVFTQDYVERAGKKLPMYEKVVSAGAAKVIVVPWEGSVSAKLRAEDLDWKSFLGESDKFVSVSCKPQDPTNLLFSSGTTGEPKVIPWSHTTPIKAASDAFLHHDVHPKEVVAWPTNLGWMMGPWLIYASLINRGTMALYYGAPLGREFGDFIAKARVNMLGLVPSIVKHWRSTDCMKGVDWSAMKAFSSTGECSNAEDYLFLMSLAGYKPVIEYCGGTEIGGAFLTGTLLQPASPATFTTPTMGLDIEILGEDGAPADKGEIYLKPPSIGLSLELLNRDHYKVYFEGAPKSAKGEVLRRHGDEVERLPGGFLRALGRADDTMNLGGIKVSSAEIERVLNQVDGVTETAAIAINPAGGGPSLLVVFVVPRSETKNDANAFKTLMQKQIREKLNPLFKIDDIVVVLSLPRTASNKVMRRTLRAQYKS